MPTYRLKSALWALTLVRRIGAFFADLFVGLSVAIVSVLLFYLMDVDFDKGKLVLPVTFAVFALFRVIGSSLGNLTFGLRVNGSSVAKNVMRLLALFAPGYNVFDWAYAIWNPTHQTFTDMKLGVRVVDDTLR